ncbi:Superoxide dismutase 1 copper chaperone [Cyphellophora attinorum]|uniref:Superoxide dismutase 1 copper chaperone n=1 Tax=Cyphellophora attinorum TaxID=1664694 RepID=A0A0N0NQ11_9EURO|nr:Superoxide dismutase 1 copper chaperone [Phialophora attinorum]KPI43149.1 Superoxide dismutase 1 copper chaperone [Phialophora attinorum]
MGSIGVESFQTTFAVPLHCDSCVESVTKVLNEVDGVHKIEAALKDQTVLVEGTAPPSAVVAAIESTGRDAILRGSGKSNGAGVCILETHAPAIRDPVRGLARMVQVGENKTLVDLTLKGVSSGTYYATVRETGDISQGAASTGGVWEAIKRAVGFESEQEPARGMFGTITVGKDGRGSTFLDRPVAIWELIGRGMVVSKSAHAGLQKNDPDTLVGVIARSAGVWDNDKVVCSCSGKTVWQERKEQQAQGML